MRRVDRRRGAERLTGEMVKNVMLCLDSFPAAYFDISQADEKYRTLLYGQ